MSSAHIKATSSLLAILFLLAGLQTASSADTAAARSAASFGDKPIFQSAGDAEYVLSGDKQAFTVLFGADFEAIAASGPLPADVAKRARSSQSAASVVTRVFSIVVPVTGDRPIRTSFTVQGFAQTSPDSSATLVFVVNGQHKAVRFGPNTDRSFVETLNYRAARASEISINVFLLAERNSSNSNALAFLRVATMDGELAGSKAAGKKK